jgi:hypothetical protein
MVRYRARASCARNRRGCRWPSCRRADQSPVTRNSWCSQPSLRGIVDAMRAAIRPRASNKPWLVRWECRPHLQLANLVRPPDNARSAPTSGIPSCFQVWAVSLARDLLEIHEVSRRPRACWGRPRSAMHAWSSHSRQTRITSQGRILCFQASTGEGALPVGKPRPAGTGGARMPHGQGDGRHARLPLGACAETADVLLCHETAWPFDSRNGVHLRLAQPSRCATRKLYFDVGGPNSHSRPGDELLQRIHGGTLPQR